MKFFTRKTKVAPQSERVCDGRCDNPARPFGPLTEVAADFHFEYHMGL